MRTTGAAIMCRRGSICAGAAHDGALREGSAVLLLVVCALPVPCRSPFLLYPALPTRISARTSAAVAYLLYMLDSDRATG